MDQPQCALQAPSCEECQRHRSQPAQLEAEPAVCGLGREVQPVEGVWGGPQSSPEPVAVAARRGHAPSPNTVHIFHVPWGSQQAVNPVPVSNPRWTLALTSPPRTRGVYVCFGREWLYRAAFGGW